MIAVFLLIIGLLFLGFLQFFFITSVISHGMKKKHNTPRIKDHKQDPEELGNRLLENYLKRQDEINVSKDSNQFISNYLEEHKEEISLYEQEKAKLLHEKHQNEENSTMVVEEVPDIEEDDCFDMSEIDQQRDEEEDDDYSFVKRTEDRFSSFPESTLLKELQDKFSVSAQGIGNPSSTMDEFPDEAPGYEPYEPVDPELYTSLASEPNLIFLEDDDNYFFDREEVQRDEEPITAPEQQSIINFLNQVDMEHQQYQFMKEKKWVAMTEKERKRYMLLEKLKNLSKLPKTKENSHETILTLFDLYRHEGRKSDMAIIKKQFPTLFKKGEDDENESTKLQ